MEQIRIKKGDYEVRPVLVLRETYKTFNYLLCRKGQAVLIDAGEMAPIIQVLDQENLQLLRILITHNHNDHVGACRAIQDRLGVQSVSPAVASGDMETLGTTCRSISTPGHVDLHKCFYFPELGILFAGDVIINGACGRIMGGTAEQYVESLQTLCALPDDTMVFGGHDYLEDNLAFGLSVEPENEATKKRLIQYKTDPAAAIFFTLAEEKKSNPFLRVESPEEFAELRRRKDRY